MKRLILIGSAMAVLALPAGAAAQPGDSDKTNAARECRAERGDTAATREAFRARYGTNKNDRNAFGKCVSTRSEAERTERSKAAENAAKICKAERSELGESAFAEKYATNKNGRNALGKCISQRAKTIKQDADKDDAKAIKARKRAAKTCAAERADDSAAFTEKYGTNEGKRNAFGKCVSATAKKA